MSDPTLKQGARDRGRTGPVRTLQLLLTHAGFGTGIDGSFGPRTAVQVKRLQARRGLAVDGVVGPHTWASLRHGTVAPHPSPHTTPGPRPSANTASTMAAYALAWAHAGHPYVWGGKAVPLSAAHPWGMDCSGLVEWAVYQATGRAWVAGSRYQAAFCTPCSVAQAINTRGALLFISSNGRHSGVHHVAVSLGNGMTAEARSSRIGCGSWSASGRFNLAGLVPTLGYR